MIKYISAFAVLAVVHGESSLQDRFPDRLSSRHLSGDSDDPRKVDSEDWSDTECSNGVCTTVKTFPTDADPKTECFTVGSDYVPQNGYKEIDFTALYLPDKSYNCVEMPACDTCTQIAKQGFGKSKFDVFYMPHTVDYFAEQAFKEIETSTGEPLRIVQMCNPADGSYTNLTKDARWAEKTVPEPIIEQSCTKRPGLAKSSKETKSAAGSSSKLLQFGAVVALNFVVLVSVCAF
mmetsp:Transcript_37953/g.44193  ORF Transcript_37953/g.44193 Transcript_37953/m.44193 type:complete len:234 (+) Transcript_37953:114-815(+)